MVGGIVREVFRFGDVKGLLIQGKAEDKDKFLAVEVKDEGDVIVPGDSVWWQSDKLMWNPKNGRWTDKQLQRTSHSYDGDQLWRQAALLAKKGICPVCGGEDGMSDGKGSLTCPCGASYDLSAMLVEGD